MSSTAVAPQVCDFTSALANAEVPVTGAATASFGRMHACSDNASPADYLLSLPSPAGNAGKLVGVRVTAGMTKFVYVTPSLTIAGDTGARLSALVLFGLTASNTNVAGGTATLYWTLTTSGSNTLVSVYSDSGGASLVCQGTVVTASLSASPTVVALSAANGSGLSGKVSVVSGANETTVASQTFTVGALVDGQPQRLMHHGESALLLCDGTGWTKVAGKTIPMACGMAPTAYQQLANGTWTQVNLNTTSGSVDNTARMADLTNHQIVIYRPGLYFVGATVLFGGSNAGASITFSSAMTVAIQKNTAVDGATNRVAELGDYGTAGAYKTVPAFSPPAQLVAGDYLVLGVWAATGTPWVFPSSFQTSLQIEEIPSW